MLLKLTPETLFAASTNMVFEFRPENQLAGNVQMVFTFQQWGRPRGDESHVMQLLHTHFDQSNLTIDLSYPIKRNPPRVSWVFMFIHLTFCITISISRPLQ